MKRAVIDVGSNSVRVFISGEGVCFRKKITTRLGEGFSSGGILLNERIEATVREIRHFFEYSILSGVKKENIYAFATAACRNAKNGDEVIRRCLGFGLKIKILSERDECEYALLGALGGKDGAILDIGGASSELAVALNGKIEYFFSLPTGAVVIFDKYKDDRELIERYTDDAVKKYGAVSTDKLYAVGGTATSVAHALIGGDYDREKVNGYYVSVEALARLNERFFTLTAEEREREFNIGKMRAEIICGGASLLIKVAKMLKLDGFTVSENDNLEGALYKLDGYGYK